MYILMLEHLFCMNDDQMYLLLILDKNDRAWEIIKTP
jgi:hypothetical protein